MTTRVRVIYNPAARGAPSLADVREALAGVASEGWEGDVVATDAPLHAVELAREAAAAGIDVVVACGGDGTVNEVINGLVGAETTLAVVPAGTANVWAKEARIPRNLRRAFRELARGERRRIDLGRATLAGGTPRYFILVAGVGFDGTVVDHVSPLWKARLGAASYVLHGAWDALSLRAQPARVRVDGEALATGLFWATVSNTRSYGGAVTLSPAARVDDGALDLTLMTRGGPVSVASYLARAFLGTLDRSPTAVVRQVRSFEVETAGFAVQVDGEYLGETPALVDVVPGAIETVVPRGGLDAAVWSHR
ncbi:MAG TPA: diacylglycerol kinase family protein [Dehalococcoidia bacterium]|nr:diacylglycerol kinase family protein [Dehalococcoidia bacterium]